MGAEKESLNRFGEFIVTNLRDRAIEHYELLEKGHWKAPSLQKLQNELNKLKPEQKDIIRRCLINSLDSGIHDFLFALQELYDFDNDIQIIVKGKNIAEISDGLHGEVYSEDGWYSKYSKYRDSPEEA
jgi:hypothetical protein